MAFINKIIDEEDIKKYQLMKIWEKHKEEERKTIKMVAKTFYQWTIDKEKEVFLIHFARFLEEDQPDHGEIYTNENIFIFYFEKKFYELILIRESEKRIFNEENDVKVLVYETSWNIKSIEPNIKISEKFNASLKEALTRYGEDGVYNKEYTKYIIEFSF